MGKQADTRIFKRVSGSFTSFHSYKGITQKMRVDQKYHPFTGQVFFTNAEATDGWTQTHEFDRVWSDDELKRWREIGYKI